MSAPNPCKFTFFTVYLPICMQSLGNNVCTWDNADLVTEEGTGVIQIKRQCKPLLLALTKNATT
eukprot:3856377-Amphidinium_carterae.3